MVITTISSAAGHIQNGAVRALAQTGSKRSPVLRSVPTLAEQGIKDQESEVILGILVPSSTPKEIVDRLNREIVQIVAQPDTREKLAAVGFDSVGSSPEVFDARIRFEIAKWAKVIQSANIKPQ